MRRTFLRTTAKAAVAGFAFPTIIPGSALGLGRPADEPGCVQKMTEGSNELLEIALEDQALGGLRVVDFLA